MTVQRNGILFSDNGALYVNGLATGTNVPATAIPMKGTTHMPIFGKFLDATGAVYVRYV
jgi:hypothetical protein